MSLAYTVPTPGSTLNSVADPEVATALNTILTWAANEVEPVVSPGAWTLLTAFGAGLSSAAGLGFYAPAARVAGDMVQLRGAIQSSGAVGVDTTLLTLPASFRPAATVLIPLSYPGSGGNGSAILTSGALENGTGTAGSGVFGLDGITYSLR